jgi:N6-adenosine-specific RNA methylase IME4
MGVPFPRLSDLPDGTYRTIVADPPWSYDDGLPGSGQRGADSHYDTLPWQMVAGMAPQISEVADSHAHLWLWCTNSFIVEAHQIAEAWGFDPKTLVTWVKVLNAPIELPPERESAVPVKERIGMGHYLRNTTEHLLFASKGNLGTERSDMPTHFFAERAEHSSKPEKSYRLISEMSEGPYLELFARDSREGWDVWGNEVNE